MSGAPFDYFVIFAEMRTGSNLLEDTLGQLEGVTCHGEAFNPDHLGQPGKDTLLGMTFSDRLKDPVELLNRIRGNAGLNGFRFFFDHEPRVLDTILQDRRCAKIVLTRNPVDCYVSLKIAYNTKRWKLTDVRDRIAWKPPFKPAEFEQFLADRQAFQLRLLKALQTTAQTAFYLDYEDVPELEVLNGLARYLGLSEEIKGLTADMVRQNPEEMSAKVRNFPEMEEALAKVDWANLARTPHFEPRRGPGVPRAIASKGAPLLYVPLPPPRDTGLRTWLGNLGNGGIEQDFTQKTLRAWKRKAMGHRSFTLVRHPLTRAHQSFLGILAEDQFVDIRAMLRRDYDVPIPPDDATESIGRTDYADALEKFLRFVAANLNGQTPVRQDAQWASQWSLIRGLADFAAPDLICREDTLAEDLGHLCRSVGLKKWPTFSHLVDEGPIPLGEIYSEDLERVARDAYPRDYMTFGFGRWAPHGQ
ncbi:MAG: nodulation protein NodH [Rhodobacteraceae bacterium]|nr:nodulation protein NodH [Paracoccaceae bacterium]